MATFSAQVASWVRDVEGAAEGILKQSAQEVVNDAQKPVATGGRMRVDTGFLRASIRGSTTSMPEINPLARPAEGSTYQFDGEDITAVLVGAELGATIYIGYTAAYAAFREFGARGQAPDAFVRTAAQKWPQIVEKVTRDLAGRLGR